MNDREEFEKGSMIGCALETPLSANDVKILHEFLAAARQPEIDALKGKLNSCVDTVCRIASGKERLKNEIAALKAENERLRKDAERYRYLRERDLNAIHRGGIFAGLTPENVVVSGDHLDRYVDAAMKETK